MERDILSGYRRYAALVVLVFASAAVVGCATPVDENLLRVQERMQAARANDSLRAQASGPFADAERALAQANEAKEPTLRYHFIYMTEKNLDIAEAIAERQQAEQELAALQRRQEQEKARTVPQPVPAPSEPSSSREPVPTQPLPAPPGSTSSSPEPVPSEAAENLVREVERERLETAIREAQEAQKQAAEAERTGGQLKPQGRVDPLVPAVPVVHFAAGTAELTPGAKRRLDPLIVQLREDETIHALVEGYTDASGAHEANLQVSLARARAVKSYLVEQGISAERVQTLGLGAEYPVASNETEEGRRQNRRVEIVLDRLGGNAGSVTGRRQP